MEERDGKLFGYEFKWNDKKMPKLPKTFIETYNAEEQVVNKKNFRDFVKI